MKLSSFAVLGAFAVAAASFPQVRGIECTPEQLEMDGGSKDDAAIEKACPALTTAGSSNLDFTDLGSFDVNALMSISPCKDESCTTYLKQQVDAVPDCEFAGLNLKTASKAVLDICVGIAEGTLTPEEIFKLFGDIAGNMTFSSSGSDAASQSSSGSIQLPTEQPSSSSSSKDSGSGSSTPSVETPVTPQPSGSSIVTVAGTAVAATATLASMLMM